MPAYGYQKKLLSEYVLGVNCDVLAVDYSLSPEATSSKIVGESIAAFEWLLDNTDNLNIDSDKLAVGGDSAGGCLAASITQFAADRFDSEIIKFQLLIYPVVDNQLSTESMALFQDAPVWSGYTTGVMWEKYLSGGKDLADYAVPMTYDDFSKLPPAYVENAEIDPLRDEAVQYANKLKEANVPVVVNEVKGVPHGYDCLLNAETTRNSVVKRIKALKEYLS